MDGVYRVSRQSVFSSEVDKRPPIVARDTTPRFPGIARPKPHGTIGVTMDGIDRVICQTIFCGEVDKGLPIVAEEALARAKPHPNHIVPSGSRWMA